MLNLKQKKMFLRVKIWLYIYILKTVYGFTKVSNKLLYAQAWHETGDFKSKVFKENKNLFGMRHPSKRKTFSKGSNLGHAVYKSHFASVRDYFERQKEFNISNADDIQYIDETVNSNYAEDTAYKTKWLNVRDIIKSPVNSWVIGGVFFCFIGILYLLIKNKKS